MPMVVERPFLFKVLQHFVKKSGFHLGL